MTTTSTDAARYSVKRVHELLGLAPAVVRTLVARGFVRPERGPRRQWLFSFQDLLLLKTAHSLRRSRVPTQRITAALDSLRRGLPQDMPLSGLRITSAGGEVVVREPGGVRQAATGQWLLDFEVRVDDQDVVRVLDRGVAQAPEPSAFERAQDLEAADPVQAERAYRAILDAHPGHVDARVNLGAMLCEQGRCREAVELFDAAAAVGVSDALLSFNHAIALEDVGDVARSADAYRHALALDPGLADAHYNLGLLLERSGDAQGALRHLNAYRRLAHA